MCYSLGLASHFSREVATWPYKQRPAFVGTFEALANQWGIASGDRDDPDFWEHRLPLLMAEKAAELPPKARFDSFVVDEAQDFAESWWKPLVTALRDEEDGGLFLYSDENQRLFQRFGRPPVPLVPLVLDHNLRNTRQIAEVFKPLAPLRMRLQGGEGPEVIHVQADPDEALGVADDQMDLLFDEGWAPGHIALLTTGRRHPEQVSRQDEDPQQKTYWDSFWDEDLPFYGHVLGFKGLERRASWCCDRRDLRGEEYRLLSQGSCRYRQGHRGRPGRRDPADRNHPRRRPRPGPVGGAVPVAETVGDPRPGQDHLRSGSVAGARR